MIIYLLVIMLLRSNIPRAAHMLTDGSIVISPSVPDPRTQLGYRWSIMFPEIPVKFVFPFCIQPNFSFVLIGSPRLFCFFNPKKTYYRFLCIHDFCWLLWPILPFIHLIEVKVRYVFIHLNRKPIFTSPEKAI